MEELAKMEPVYETLKGWSDDIAGVRRFDDLPVEAQAYVNFIEKETGVPITMIGVGPARDECIFRG